MRVLTKYILALVVLSAGAAGAEAGEIRAIANVDSSKDIYVGEAFTYQIILDGGNRPGQVDLTPVQKYSPKDAGGGNASQTSISIVNGQMTKSEVKRYVMNYLLTAGQAGSIIIPPLTVTIDGKSYQTNPVQVNILKPGSTDQLELEVALSDSQCYVGQPVIMTVKLYVYADIGDYQFDIPALDGDTFYIEESDASDGRQGQYRLTRNGREAILLTFNKVLIPKSPGEIAMAPASVSADVAVGRASSRNPFGDFFGSRPEYKRFLVSSQPLKLNVLPLPQQDKPAEFYGLVGRFSISASASPTKVNVGDPITLTIKISGAKYLKPVQWPALDQIPELAANFKIPSEKASPTVENGFKVFTQTIRPANDKASAIPPIPLAYFDADKGRYVVARTEPINLEVAPTRILTTADLEGKELAPVSKEIEAIKKGLSANYERLDALDNAGFSPLAAVIRPAYFAAWAGPLGVLVLSIFVKLFTHTSPEKAAQKRRKRACRNAVSRLRKIGSADSRQKHELVGSIVKQYVGDRFDKVAGSLTADDCRQAVLTATQNAPTADALGDIIAGCEAARYASVGVDLDPAQIHEVIELIRTIERKSGKPV